MWYEDFLGPALSLDGSDEQPADPNGHPNYRVHGDIVIDQTATWT